MKDARATNALTGLVQGLALGAAAMYMLDPDRGRRRRAVTRDKIQRFANDSVRLANQATRDARQRLHGVNARLQQRSTATQDVDELRLIERVRSALGRRVSHPHAVQVGARGATVVLSGPILRDEVDALLDAVRDVPGVHEVEDHLDVHASDDGVPSLQGEPRRRASMGAPQSWPPALRMATLLGGSVLALYGLAKRNAAGLLLASAGVGVAARAVSNEPLDEWLADMRQMLSRAEDDADEFLARTGLGNDGTPSRELRKIGGGLSDASHERGVRRAIEGTVADVPLLGQDGTPAVSSSH